MALLGALQVRLGLDASTFTKSFQGVARDAKKGSDNLAKSFAGLSKFKGVLTGIVAGVAGNAFAEMIQGANDLTDSLRDSSIKLGIGISELQAFQLAAGNAGVESAKLEGLIGKLNKAAGEIKLGGGTDKVIASFDALGISVEEIKKSDPATLFVDVIEALGKIEDPASRAALAMQVFGKSGQAALTMVADGAGASREAMKLLDDLGLSLTKIDGTNVDKANDALGTLSFVAQAAKQKFAAELSPAIASVAQQLLDAGKNGKSMGERISEGAKTSITVFQKLSAAGQVIGNTLQAAWEGAKYVVTGLAVDISRAIASIIDFVGTDVPIAFKGLLQAGEENLTKLEQKFRDFATDISNAVIDAINSIIKGIETMVNASVPMLNKVIDAANSINPFGKIGRAGTVAFPPIGHEGKTKVTPYDLGSSDIGTFGADWAGMFRASADDLAKQQFDYGEGFLDQFEDLKADWDTLWGTGDGMVLPAKPLEDLAKATGDATDQANQLAGALAGSGSGGSKKGGVAGALDDLIPKAILVGEEMKIVGLDVQNVWTDSMQSISGAIDQFVQTGKLSFKDLASSILQSIASAAIKNAINSLFSALGGATGGGANSSNGNGWIGTLLRSFQASSFAGGGYTGSGPRTGGLDGQGGRLAMIHPQETVIDHAKVRGRSGSNRRPAVALSVPITLMPGVSREELARLMPILKKDIIQTIPALIARGGRYASGFGQ